MATPDHSKRISATAYAALQEALVHVYWYKNDLRSYLQTSLDDNLMVSRLNWSQYKRLVVEELVRSLVKNEDQYQQQVLRLMSDLSAFDDFSHLERLEDGKKKAATAKSAVSALKVQMRALNKLYADELEVAKRRDAQRTADERRNAFSSRLETLRNDFVALVMQQDERKRGFMLEKLLREVFELFDLDPKGSFRNVGEQIDGAFSFDGTDYLLEAKWQAKPVGAADLDSFSSKVARRLDNTLGLFLSINGFSPDGVTAHASGNRRVLILMDGADLTAVFEGRIELTKLLLRKRRAAAQTGNIYVRIREIL